MGKHAHPSVRLHIAVFQPTLAKRLHRKRKFDTHTVSFDHLDLQVVSRSSFLGYFCVIATAIQLPYRKRAMTLTMFWL